MNGEELQCVRVGPDDAQNSVIWLHGLGADGYDFEPIVAELNFPSRSQTRFIFPHAPIRPVTVNGGMRMRAWYDIVAIDEHSPEDAAGIRDSAARVATLIQQELNRGVAPQRLVLAGFSQGGAIALHLAVRHVPAVAGVLALSAYLPMLDCLAGELPAPPRPAVFMAHGDADPVVPLHLAQASRAALEQQGFGVQWHTYPMDHTLIPEEIDDIARWFRDVLP